jgi:hypothetical protein
MKGLTTRLRAATDNPSTDEHGPDAPARVDNSISEYSSEVQTTIRAVEPYTMTSPERIAALINAIDYISKFRIPGAIVECGVWRGGSMMAVARELQQASDLRPLYLFDTFEGMPPPDDIDTDRWGRAARDIMASEDPATSEVWAVAGFDEVRSNILGTGYPEKLIHLVQGRVEDTIPGRAPESIALLRLDTDFYQSTRHELEHLIPRVSTAGVLIVDDYGHWEGARRAIDEWLHIVDRPVLLNRIDYTGRIAVLP